MSVLSSNLVPFVKLYFSHPFWKSAEVENPYIRLTYAYSDFAREQLERKGRLSKKLKNWHIRDRVYSRSDFRKEAVGDIIYASDHGGDTYYNVNVSPRNFGQFENIPVEKYATRARAEHVTNCLYIPIDWDGDLPVGPLEIFRELGIEPACVIRSSNRNEKARYQALISVAPEDSREFDYWKRVVHYGAEVLGADPSSAAENKLFRLPGSVNWKEFQIGKQKDYSLLIHSNPSAEAYSLEALAGIFEEFADTELSETLISVAPQKYRDTSKILHKAKYSKPRLIDITWQEALQLGEGYTDSDGKNVVGKPPVGRGERHNALVSWAGSLSNDVGRGLYTQEEAEELLGRLCQFGCAWSASERDDAGRELQGALKHLRSCLGKDGERRARAVAVFLKDYAPESSDDEERHLEVAASLPSASSGETAGGAAGGAAGETASVAAILQTKINEFCHPLKSESPEEWLDFLALFFRECKETSESTGHVHDLTTVLMQRAETLHLLQDIGFFLPATVKTAWGSEARVLRQVTKEQLRNYCDISVQRLLKSALTARDALKKLPVFGPTVKKLKEAAREEVRTGADTFDEDAYRHTLKLKLQKYFDLRLSAGMKRVIIDAWTDTVTAWSENRDALIENVAVFQNGTLDYSSGVFTPDEMAWRKSRFALHSRFDVSLVDGVRALNTSSDVNSLDEIEEFLSTHIPRFTRFMRSAFPGDVPAWVIMLRIVGYTFIVNNPFDAFFSFYGESGAGKGTMWRLIESLIGDADNESGLTYALDFLIAANGKGGFVKAIRKLAVNIDEAESTDPKVHERVFRQINMMTSGQKVQLEEKWEKSGRVRMGAKFIFTANKPFMFDDTKGAIERRMVALHFGQIITQQDPNLLKNIIESEAEKIATLSALFCARAWGRGRMMFEGARATREGRRELVHGLNPVKGMLSQFILPGKSSESVYLPVLIEMLRQCSDKLSTNEKEKLEEVLSSGDVAVSKRILGELKRLRLDVAVVRGRLPGAPRNSNKVASVTGIKINLSALKTAEVSEKRIISKVNEDFSCGLERLETSQKM